MGQSDGTTPPGPGAGREGRGRAPIRSRPQAHRAPAPPAERGLEGLRPPGGVEPNERASPPRRALRPGPACGRAPHASVEPGDPAAASPAPGHHTRLTRGPARTGSLSAAVRRPRQALGPRVGPGCADHSRPDTRAGHDQAAGNLAEVRMKDPFKLDRKARRAGKTGRQTQRLSARRAPAPACSALRRTRGTWGVGDTSSGGRRSPPPGLSPASTERQDCTARPTPRLRAPLASEGPR